MNIEEIKQRHKQDELDMNKVSKGLIHEDRGYLLSLIDRYKTVLERIVSKGPEDTVRVVTLYNEWQEQNKGNWPDYVYDIANSALEKDQKNRSDH